MAARLILLRSKEQRSAEGEERGIVISKVNKIKIYQQQQLIGQPTNHIGHLDESLEPGLVLDVEAVEGDSSCEVQRRGRDVGSATVASYREEAREEEHWVEELRRTAA